MAVALLRTWSHRIHRGAGGGPYPGELNHVGSAGGRVAASGGDRRLWRFRM